MRDTNLREGKVFSDYCKCGHLKDHHVRDADGNLQCQDYNFKHAANKMLQCGCKI